MLAAGMAKRYGGCKPLAPLGLHGEAIIDLTASDALAAGFGRIVVVVGPGTSPAITYHVGRTWPSAADVSTAMQPNPLGTAHALLCARRCTGDGAFGVVNADDVYGVPALTTLREGLERGDDLLVGFHLSDTVLTGEPVTRGVTLTDASGHLTGLAERRKVVRNSDGTFTTGDGAEPEQLAPDALVSMNLWGFQPGMWQLVEDAVRSDHPDVGPDGRLEDESVPPQSDDETLLPEVVGRAVSDGILSISLLEGEGRCVGVTHADDLPVARAELARMVGRGERAEWLWERPT